MKPRRTPRWTRLVTATVMVGVMAAGCGAVDDSAESAAPADPAPTAPPPSEPAPTEPRVVSAEEGVAARVRYVPLQRSTDVASDSLAAETSTLDCPVDFVPTPDELAETNSGNIGLIEAFDRFGIEYSSSTDDVGYLLVEYAFDDVVAQSIADSYWIARYPALPIPQEELDAVVAQNDVVAEQLDAAGATYERRTDESGYESLEYDYDDPIAQAAVDAAWLIISPPQPPTPEQLAQQSDDNDKLMAAFDEAGIAYELVADELGWAWVEWEYDDPATSEQYVAILDELYPPISIDPIQECEFVSEPIAIDMPTLDQSLVDPIEGEVPVDELEAVPIEEGPSPDEVARRGAEIDAMVAGFTAAMVDFDVVGDSPWQSVVFDLADDASVPVISSVVTARA